MEYKDFFENVGGFLKQAEKHKRRGNNDFNPYLEMWSGSNEVKLHSALICGFLNPLGNHYQGDVFLETFLESVGLQEWFGDTSNAEVHKERKRIDIYITNGKKHIIVENKTKAGDQDRQIERYIEAIAKADSSDDMESNELESSESETKQVNKAYENIAVLYLTPDAKDPTQQSLGKWEIQGDFLVNENNQVRYKAISYKEHIIKWLDSALNEAGGISNLRMAIECYTDVVKRLTGQKENTMDLQAFFNKEENKQFLDIALGLAAKRDELVTIQFSAIAREIENKHRGHYRIRYNDSKDWMGICHNDFNNEKLKFFIFVFVWYGSKRQKVWFGVALDGNSYDMTQTPALIAEMKTIGVDKIHQYTLKTANKPTNPIHLPENPNYELKDFTQEKFINFFESVRKQTDEFNQKIADDLAKGQGSKLAKFLLDNN